MAVNRMAAAVLALALLLTVWEVGAWTGEVNGRVVCDLCGDASVGPEDQPLEGGFLPSIIFLC